MATTYEKIATTTLGSAAATIDFTSIGSGYTDLRIVASLKGDGTGYTDSVSRIAFNSDLGGTTYSYTWLRGDGSSASSGRSTNSPYCRGYQSGSQAGNQPSFYIADIFSYAGSTNKTVLVEASADLNGSGYVYRMVNLWRNTAAITSISLSSPNGDNLVAGSTATLYGILKA
jgi:hypothetical protein